MGQIKNIKLHIVTDIKRIKPQRGEKDQSKQHQLLMEMEKQQTNNKSNKVTWRPCCCAINLLGRPLADVDAESSLWIMIEIEEFVIHFQNCFLFCLLYISSVVVIHF